MEKEKKLAVEKFDRNMAVNEVKEEKLKYRPDFPKAYNARFQSV